MKKSLFTFLFSIVLVSASFLGGAPAVKSAADDNFGLPIKTEKLSVSSDAKDSVVMADALPEMAENPTISPFNPNTDSEVISETDAPPKADADFVAENADIEDTFVVDEKPKQVDLYIWGKGITLKSFPIIENDTLLLPAKELLENLGIYDFSVDDENQITITYGEKLTVMNIASKKARIDNEEITLLAAPVYIGETVYAPMRTLCEGFGYIVIAEEKDSILTVFVDSPIPEECEEEIYVNKAGITSETPYLVWVNKSKYTVNVFLKEKGRWDLIYTCKCSIGTDSTPTVTGTFKYFSREKRWTYPDFYVGPIMRFYKGYAIHSTLLKYDGSNYNATVGKKLSHGCVRVLPEDINWLVCYVPLRTTIHVT